jgi:transcription elongation factor Elf1
MSNESVLPELRQMDAYEFEQLVANVWEQRGWDTTVTSGSADRGIDVIAKRASPIRQKQLIQAKRYAESNRIGAPDIQQYSSLKHQESNVDAVVVVTTSSFTSQAQQTATDLNVKLVSGRDLVDMMSDLNIQYSTSSQIKAQKDKQTHHPWNEEKYKWESNPTKVHEYFRDCPICNSDKTIWYGDINNSDDELLKCSDCEVQWMKDLRSWELNKPLSHNYRGLKMDTDEWKNHPRWKNEPHPWNMKSYNYRQSREPPTKDHKYFQDCPICDNKNSIWYRYSDNSHSKTMSDVKLLKCDNCGVQWAEDGGLFQTKWKLTVSYNYDCKKETKTTSEWKNS